MLSAVSKFLSTLLVTLLTGLVFTTVLHQTLLNSHYIENKLAATNSYERLSTALTDQASQAASGIQSQQIATMLKPILTPDVLKTKINSALDQMQAYYEGNGPRPTIDLTDLAAQAQTAGVPIPADSPLVKPIQLSPSSSSQAKGSVHSLDFTQNATIIGTVVVAVLLLVVSWRRHRWVALPDVLIVTGVLLGLGAAIIASMSDVLAHRITLDTTANAFTSLGRDLATAIASDFAHRLGVVAAVFAVVGIIARIVVGRIAARTAKPAVNVKPKQASAIIS